MSDDSPADAVTVRRTKRSSAAISPVKPSHDSSQIQTTPSRRRPQKRARFSEPVPSNDTTGLTPAVGKASLRTPKPRRVSTPGPTRYQDHEEVHYTPFREVLEPRIIRRIRRHGLSEEMHQYQADKKVNSQLRQELDQKNKELQNLKTELEASRLRQVSVLQTVPAASQERINELEAEVQELNQRSSLENSAAALSWHNVPLGSSSPLCSEGEGNFQIFEDASVANDQNDDAEDALTMGQELESARQTKQAFFRSSQSFSSNDVHFADSPARSVPKTTPAAPEISSHDLSKELNAAVNRAEEAEVALQAMNMEIQSLGFPTNDNDAVKSITNIKNHFRDMRLVLERAIPGETVMSFDNARLMPEIISKLKMVAGQVRDREAELRSMRDQQRSLKGNFEHALVATEKANARIKELEEIVDHNAEEMLEQRMRAQALEREAKEHESNNQCLIAAIEKYRAEVKRLEDLVQLIETEQASRLQDVRTATLAEVTQQLSDMDAKVAAETRGRRAAEESAVDRLRKINELESALSTARQHSEDVKDQLTTLERQLATSKLRHEEETGGLNSRVSSLSTALSAAVAEIDKLRSNNAKLEDRYRNEVEAGAQAVERIQNEFIRSVAKLNEEKKSYIRGAKVRYANWELESDDLASDDVAPMTPASIVRFSDFSEVDADEDDADADGDHVEGRVEVSRGRRKGHRRSSRASGPGLGILKRGRRRYDSGIGMDSLSEADGDDGNDEARTPDLSSEADLDIDIDIDHDADVMV